MANNLESNTAPGVQSPVSSGATIFATDSAPKQLSDGNAAGTILGLTIADLIGFFGTSTPASQAAGGFLSTTAAFAIGGGGVMTLATSQSPVVAGVAVGNTSEASFTLLSATAAEQVISGDILYINKPTAQANLGVGNVRVSATNVAGVTFTNVSSSLITPTAGEKYGFVALRGMATITQVLTPAVIPLQTTLEQQFTLAAGNTALPGEILQVMKPTRQAYLDVVGCRVVSTNVVGITFSNISTAATTPTAGETYTFFSVGNIGEMDNQLLIQAPLTNSAAVASTALTELIMAVSGITVNDVVYGYSKPSFQSAVTAIGTRVSAGGNVVAVTFMGTSSTATTPVSNEIYGLSVWRPQPAAAMISYAQTLSPASVASQAMAEQTFTITGVLPGSMVWVNKGSFTPGLGIAGVRALSTTSNSIGINFFNATTAAITPPSETYYIANFQQIVPDAGVSWVFTESAGEMKVRQMLGRIRDAITAMGLVASY